MEFCCLYIFIPEILQLLNFTYIYIRKGIIMKSIRLFVKQKRKEFKLTQEDLALNAGVGLRFVRDLEQGKKTLRLDKVNDVLNLFGKEVGVIDKNRD
jgi:y4mF family transcriptional regulator